MRKLIIINKIKVEIKSVDEAVAHVEMGMKKLL
jgi:ribosomal protein S1